jgi:mono/diheme cytochrome c family protein
MRRVLRWLLRGLIAFFLLVALGSIALYGISAWKINRAHDVPADVPQTPASSASVAHGEHLARAVLSCGFCHGDDLGGMTFVDSALGLVAGTNLTRGRGGIGASFKDADWIRAVRHGVGPDGRSLIVMPSETYVYLSEPDMASLLAYVKQLPAVDREVPKTRFRWLGRALVGAGRLRLLTADKTANIPYPPDVPRGPSREYGRYLAVVSGCHGCHGDGLSGGPVAGPPGTPPASNLTSHPGSSFGHWSEVDFVHALRTGIRPDGTPINPFMPWVAFSRMTDDEIHAVWLYLRSMPPKPFGHK